MYLSFFRQYLTAVNLLGLVIISNSDNRIST